MNGQKIEYVFEYSYLEQIISFEERGLKELRKKAAKAWSNFWEHNTILKSFVSIDTKMKVFNQCVVLSLTYATQTWSLINTQRSSLKVTYYKMLRNI